MHKILYGLQEMARQTGAKETKMENDKKLAALLTLLKDLHQIVMSCQATF
jgi:hypothetical protein